MNITNLDGIEALERRMSFFVERGYKELYEKEYNRYLDLLIENFYKVNRFFPNEKQVLADLRNKFLQVYNVGIKQVLPGSSRIKYTLFYFSPFVCKQAIAFWDLGNVLLKTVMNNNRRGKRV